MMRLLQVLAVVGGLGLSPGVLAQNMHSDKSFGLGIGGGLLSNGLTIKGFVRPDLSIQGWVGWYGFASTNLGADLIHEGRRLWTNGDLALNWQAGGGAAVWVWNPTLTDQAISIAINGVLGLSLQIQPVPLEFVLDLRPTVVFGPYRGGLYITPGVAIRYYF